MPLLAGGSTGLLKQGQISGELALLGIAIGGSQWTHTRGVFQAQSIHRVIKEKRAIRTEIQQIANHHAPGDQLCATTLQRRLIGTAKGARWELLGPG